MAHGFMRIWNSLFYHPEGLPSQYDLTVWSKSLCLAFLPLKVMP